jgi:shikimate dehydrogenase
MTGPVITGRTGIVFILGDPVAQIIGSAEMNRSFVGWGMDIAVSPLHVRAEDLEACVSLLRKVPNVVGFGLTIPHKISIVPLVDHLTDAARQVGAVNFVRRNSDGSLTGTNMDGAGFIQGLKDRKVTLTGRSVLLIGAGGAARAIGFALAEAGVGKITLVNRTHLRATALARDIQTAARGCQIDADTYPLCLRNFDLLVNTTSVGMGENSGSPIDLAGLTKATVVADVIMKPSVTVLLADAAARGCVTIGGKAMLRPQAELVAKFLNLEAASPLQDE